MPRAYEHLGPHGATLIPTDAEMREETLAPSEDEPEAGTPEIRAVWQHTPSEDARVFPSAASLADTLVAADAEPAKAVAAVSMMEILAATGTAVALLLLGVAFGVWWAAPAHDADSVRAIGVMSVERGD